MTETEPITVAIDSGTRVSGLLQSPRDPRAGCVLAHGAGAGMTHPFMTTIADGLAERRIATLRFQFPYMERGSRRPDSPAAAHAAIRAAVAEARRRFPGLPLIAGGKSYGGRMTSQAQAESALDGVAGLVFLGFPLHAPRKPSATRAEHLAKVDVPMLFLQGTRDGLADLELLRPIVNARARATLKVIDDGDHSFHVRAKSGRTDDQAMNEMLDAIEAWLVHLE